MTLRRLSLLLALVGGGLVLAGVLVGGDTSWIMGIEGAYFTRAAGTPAHSRVFDTVGEPQLLSLRDGNLWLGAGLALLIAAAVGSIAHGAGLRLVRARD